MKKQTRREFMTNLGCSVAAAALIPGLTGCASPGVFSGTRFRNGTVRMPRVEVETALADAGVLEIKATGVLGRLLLHETSNNELIAVSNICTHRGCEVRVFPDSLRCPCHGSEFELTGEVLEGPAEEPLATYSVQVTETEILIKVEQ
jgi:cytochrome b6-f complex iron-sulfur subunit